MLLRTHGVLYIIKQSSSPNEAIALRHYLEVPTLFCNHSCEPTLHCLHNTEDTAVRDIEVGEEITVDYATCDNEDYHDYIKVCFCGAPSCRGKIFGFSSLSAVEREALLPTVTPANLATYEAVTTGKGPPIIELDEMIPRPMLAAAGVDSRKAMRLMWPGPSWAEACVVIKRDEKTNQYGLYSTKDVNKGRRLYAFWRQGWPQGDEKTLVDMVFSAPDEAVDEGDIQEGTVVRLDATKCGSYRNAKGQMMFAGWEMLNTHSCDPNVVYRNKERDEKDKWQSAYAAKNIKKGDRITMDWNCFTWDRAGSEFDADMAVCHCRTSNCVGTKQGFKYLSPEAQNERINMTWLRETGDGEGLSGNALSPHVRAMFWRAPHDDGHDDAIATSCSDTSSITDSKED
jgi:hypothetical protein